MLSADAPILYVENEPDDVLLLKRAFKKAGVVQPLKVVENGEEAQAYLLGAGAFSDRVQHPLPALILLDLSMPLMSGLEVLKWRLTQTAVRSIPVIVFTSSRHTRDVEEAFQLGANAYLVKPASAEGLVELAGALKLFWLTHSELPRVSTAGAH